MHAADESHCTARQRRLIVAEKRSGARQPNGYIIGAGLNPKVSGNREWRVRLAIQGQNITRAVYHGDDSGRWRSSGCSRSDDRVYICSSQSDRCRRGGGRGSVNRELRSGLVPGPAADQENREHYQQDYGSGDAEHQHVAAPLMGAACGHGFSQCMHWPWGDALFNHPFSMCSMSSMDSATK